MSLELSVPDDAPDPSVPDQSLLERLETVERRAADATALDELASRLDRIETRLNRPSARVEVREDQAQLEQKAFTSWCRKGWEGLGDLERKVLIAGTGGSPDPSGWQTIPEVLLTELVRNLVLFSPMRSVARVQQVSAGPVLVPKRTSTATAAWVAETVEHAVSEPAYTQMSVGIYEARVTTEATNQLLEDSAFNIAAELARDFGQEFARLEGLAFVRGNGTSEPGGWWSAADFTTVTGGALDVNDLVDLYHSVPSVYASNGTWLMNRANMGNVRKLTTTPGVPLWTDSIAPGNPPSLLGRPLLEIPDLTTAGSPAAETVIAFGDWTEAFRIFDRVGLEVLRDPYTLAKRSIVCFHARKRVGSALVNAEAVKGLTIAA